MKKFVCRKMPITNMWFSVTFITFLEEQKLFFFRMCLQIFFRKFVYCTKHSSFFSLPANSHRSPFCDHTAFRMQVCMGRLPGKACYTVWDFSVQRMSWNIWVGSRLQRNTGKERKV